MNHLVNHFTHIRDGLEQKILFSLASDRHIDAADINVTLHGRIVVLDGYVDSESEAERVLQIAYRIAGKSSVKDQMLLRARLNS